MLIDAPPRRASLPPQVQVCVPRSFSLQTQVALARALLEGLGVGGLSVTHQAICALYAYNTTSGIVVDLGDRLDIVPITDGRLHSRGPPLGRVSRGRRRSTFARSSRDRPFRKCLRV